MCMNSPLSHMSYHSVYGSWIGLRAVVVLDLDLSVANFLGAKRAENCICEGFPFLSFSPIECDKKAKKLLEELMMSTNYFDDHKQEDVWRKWMALRTICDKPYPNYSWNQAAYHYSKNQQYLMKDIEQVKNGCYTPDYDWIDGFNKDIEGFHRGF